MYIQVYDAACYFREGLECHGNLGAVHKATLEGFIYMVTRPSFSSIGFSADWPRSGVQFWWKRKVPPVMGSTLRADRRP